MSEVNSCKRESIVEVRFLDKRGTGTYYNDRFDLKCGDLVFVEARVGCHRARVIGVNYHVTGDLAEYKHVDAVVDTSVNGNLYLAGTHVVAFDRSVLSVEKVQSWMYSLDSSEDSVLYSYDDSEFRLAQLDTMNVDMSVYLRGYKQYIDGKVCYLCLDGTSGYAIVDDCFPYELYFEYENGMISNLSCSCSANYHCKHDVAMLLKLRELLEWIEGEYKELYEETGFFSAIDYKEFTKCALDGKTKGVISLKC